MRSSPAQTGRHDSSRTNPPSRSETRVLVVEDNGLQAYWLTRELEKAGFDVDGPWLDELSALRQIEADPPDFALLDLDLRGGAKSQPVNAVRIASALQQWDVPYAMVSGHRDLRLLELRNVPWFFKPVDVAQIIAHIDGYCAGQTPQEPDPGPS